jgi:hypothetical protein
MARVLSLLVLPILAQAAFVSLRKPTDAAPLATKPAAGHVVMTAEQKKAAHSGCMSACSPTPVEAKCVTECETAMYRCIDETGPNETPKDTDKCQAGVLKLYTDTKGVAKKAEAKKEGAKKEEKKAEKKKAKMFLQLSSKDVDDADDDVLYDADEESQDGDDESAYEGDEDVTGGREASEDESSEEDAQEEEAGSDEEETSEEDDVTKHESFDEKESFLQKSRDEPAVGDMTNDEATEKASLVAQADEDKADVAERRAENDDEEAGSDEEEESFVQTKKRNIDDDNAEAAEMARLEAQSDKDMGEDDDASSKTDDDDSAASEDEESFVQTKARNIDDDNADAAEMARLEAQSDKDMGEDDDTTSTKDDADSSEESEE